jgi:hypothetical protein
MNFKIRTLITLVAIPLLLFSCSPKIVPIKGSYQNKPFEMVSNNSKDVVWDKIIDLFAQTGFSIKIIDRSSGLIISDKGSLKYSRENKKGELRDKNAWVVLDAVYQSGSTYLVPISSVTGEWNVRIKDADAGKTNININLVNIAAYYMQGTGPYAVPQVLRVNAKSTGNFEKLISDKIK